MSTIKVGDRVKVSETPDVGAYTGVAAPLWHPWMDAYKGRIGTVESFSDINAALCVRFDDGDSWYFRADDLALVPAETTLPTAHVHAASMLLYAQDAAETDKPWLRWEFNERVLIAPWTDADEHPHWEVGMVYRRKPITIRIGEFDVPEPLRVAPAVGTYYFVLELSGQGVARIAWDADPSERRWLKDGLIHLTQEAADLHAKALLSLTKGA